MIDDRTLFWYYESRFTAADVTRASALSERSQRVLAKLGILQPIPQELPHKRLFDSRMVKRASAIAPLNQLKLSLEVAGRIVYAAPILEDLTFGIIDPWDITFDAGSEFDHKTKLWERRKAPHNRDKWFDPKFPVAEDEADYFIEIINGRYVGCRVSRKDPPGVFGELVDDMTCFVWWRRAVPHMGPSVGEAKPQWQYDQSMSAEMLRSFDFKDDTDEDEAAAKAACENPISQITINASVALRAALRRLVFVDGPAPKSPPSPSQHFMDKWFAGRRFDEPARPT
jgi:hypothetical protein